MIFNLKIDEGTEPTETDLESIKTRLARSREDDTQAIFDVRNIKTVNRSIIGFIAEIKKCAEKKGKIVRIAGANDKAKKALETAGLITSRD